MALFTYGIVFIIGIIISLILSIVGLFIGHIILFDSIALAIITGVVSNSVFSIHPALSLVIGIVLFALLFWLQNTKFGFWIIGGLLSLVWGYIFSIIAYMFSDRDVMWHYVVLGLGTVLMMGLHIKARDS